MKKVYYLKTCDTCKKILAEFDLEGWTKREIKTEPVTPIELQKMYDLVGSYQALFSKRSTQIKTRNIDVLALSEEDFRELILEHYSFLKRPVFITDKDIFVGNDKKTLTLLKEYFQG